MSLAALLAGLAAALAATGTSLLVAAVPGGQRRGTRSPPLLRLLVWTGARVAPATAARDLETGLAAAGRPRGLRLRDLEARLAAAGRPAGLRPRDLLTAKLAGAALAGVVGVGLFATAPGRLAVALVLAAPVGGFLAPDLWLARRAAERARRIRRQLPALLDLLRVTVESGSSLAQALRDVGARTGGPLAVEWRAVGRQVALGVPLETALDGMTERAPLPEVRALVAALHRARHHGAPLADTLAAQARDARFALARQAREEAAKAGPKIQLVVALLLVPSVLLLVAAALLSALIGGGGTVLPA
ncbi:MAG: tight adherence protein [Thermoleophilaceae bacterium]|nr:tight adherence protein [Thermoleophilaceae bacterium]